MHWFKIHHGFSSDAKLALVAHKMEESRATINGIFLDLLEYASKQEERGSLVGYNVGAGALAMGVSDQFMSDVMSQLRNVTIVTAEKVVNWDRYQSGADSTAAERQRRHRDKKKQELNEVSRDSNVTSPLRNVDKSRVDKKKDKGDFDSWWKIYPRKVGKGAARKAYANALTKTTPEILLQSLSVCKFPAEEKFIPHASTWLNEERWDDSANGTEEVPLATILKHLEANPDDKTLLSMKAEAEAKHA